MKDIIKHYIATFTVVILMLISLTYCAPTADALDNNIKPANYTQLRLDAEQRQADNEVKQLADKYAKMSDTERMKGVVYEDKN